MRSQRFLHADEPLQLQTRKLNCIAERARTLMSTRRCGDADVFEVDDVDNLRVSFLGERLTVDESAAIR